MILTFEHSIIILSVMLFKNIFNLNSLRQKIKLDNSENDFIVFQEEKNPDEQKVNNDKYSGEWNQEYELIYSSYVLDN
jgi:hypothetical protein